MTNPFSVQPCAGSAHFKLVQYPHGNSATVVESQTPRWTDRAEADAACARVNAGDESGITFASFADD